MSKAKLILIDGHAMCYRAHYALAGKLTNADGVPTETIHGFLKTTFKAIADHNPTHLCLVFDPVGGTFRHKMYEKYKANRKSAPDELKSQIEELQQICKDLQLPILRIPGFEADDVLASIVTKFHENADTIIYSGDKDLFALFDYNVTLYRPGRMGSDFNAADKKWLLDKYTLKPEQITDFLTLMGDSSDNIPGVQGIGEKTAIKLLNEFDSVDNLYENLDKVSSKSVQTKLSNGKQDAELSRRLVQLDKNVDFSLSFEQLEWPGQSKPELGNVLSSKGFSALEKDFLKLWGQKIPKQEPQKNKSIGQNRNLVGTDAEISKLTKLLESAAEFAIDTETTSKNAMEAQLLGIAFALRLNKEVHSYYIPLNFLEPAEILSEPYPDLSTSIAILDKFKPILTNPNSKKIGQNLKYDILVLKNHGINLAGASFDTMLASFLLNPNSRRHSLDLMAEDNLNHKTISYTELVGTGKKAIPLHQVPIDQLVEYATEDAEVTLLLAELLEEKLTAEKLESLYSEIDLPLMSTLVEIEFNGVTLDEEAAASIQKEMQQELEILESGIYKAAGRELNIKSTKELSTLLFDELGISSLKKTEKGARSTNAEALELIAHEHEIIPLILRHRLLSKLLSTYLEPLPGYINRKTNRIHTSLNQAVAATGRLASSDPNLQNIPIKGEEGRKVRSAFCAASGFELLSLDYSQIELRILAHYSKDPQLISAYQNNQDIHDQASYLLFYPNFDQDSNSWNFEASEQAADYSFSFDQNILDQMKATTEWADLRSKAKILNFSIVYGVTEFGLARNLKIPQREAAKLIELYKSSYPGILEYMEQSIELAKEKGYSENYFGRRRNLPDINAKNRFTRQAAERLAINTPIQSTAADLIKLVMIKLQKDIEKQQMQTRMILQIHDELLFEVPVSEKEEAYKLIKNHMENTVQFGVPLVAEGSFAKNWQLTK